MEWFATIVALIVGWALNEASQYLRSSKDHKSAIANALSILLEVRYQMLSIEYVFGMLKEQGAPDALIPRFRLLMNTIIPSTSTLDSDYAESMKVVARTAPVLAYQYRSRNSISSFIQNWRTMASEHGAPLEEIEKMESQLNSLIVPKLNKIIIELAKTHSYKSYKEVISIIEKPIELPKELSGFFDEIKRKANNTL